MASRNFMLPKLQYFPVAVAEVIQGEGVDNAIQRTVSVGQQQCQKIPYVGDPVVTHQQHNGDRTPHNQEYDENTKERTSDANVRLKHQNNN